MGPPVRGVQGIGLIGKAAPFGGVDWWFESIMPFRPSTDPTRRARKPPAPRVPKAPPRRGLRTFPRAMGGIKGGAFLPPDGTQRGERQEKGVLIPSPWDDPKTMIGG